MKKRFLFFAAISSMVFSFLCPAKYNPCRNETYTFMHGGLKRTFRVCMPANADTTKPLPMLIVLHGGGGTGKGMIKLTGGKFNQLSGRENFIVVYPDAFKKNWNDGRLNLPPSYTAHHRNIDDVGFISALIDGMVKMKYADPARIYVTGMSNGAMMTHRLAIELSHKIAAAAPVCGNIPADLKSVPANPVAMMIINGTDDPLVPFEGGFVHFKKRQAGKILSTNESVTFWVNNNKTNTAPVVSDVPDTDPADGCRVRKTEFLGPQEVVLIAIQGGGHTWPGGLQYLGEKWIGKTSRYIDACEMIWEFCKRHSR